MIINPTITVIRLMNRQGHISLKQSRNLAIPKRMEMPSRRVRDIFIVAAIRIIFVETDNTGKMIKAFHPGYKTDRVVKNDFIGLLVLLKCIKEELYSS